MVTAFRSIDYITTQEELDEYVKEAIALARKEWESLSPEDEWHIVQKADSFLDAIGMAEEALRKKNSPWSTN